MSGAHETVDSPSGAKMSATAWRGVGLLLMAVGTVVALLGAARIEGVRGAGGAVTWQSRPQRGLLSAGTVLLVVSVGLLRRRGGGAAAAGQQSGAREGVARMLRALRAVQAGRPAGAGDSSSSASLPAALDVLMTAGAPEGGAPYGLWLKLQLDPLLEEQFPALFAQGERDAFIRQHGLSRFAAVYAGLARAERLLLRAWSAAVDGYAGEAREALGAAVAQLAATEEEMAR
jgi:hypothetical protein